VKNGSVRGRKFYKCKNCNRRFIGEKDLPLAKKGDLQIIATAIDMFFEGLSTRKIQRQLENIYGRKISNVTIWTWIIKYSKLAGELLAELIPKLSEKWQVDETTIPCREGKGLLKWFWQIIDEETRWMVATHISEERDAKEATKLFKKALELAKSKPSVLITDGLWAYEKAYKKVFWTRYKAERPTYVRNLGIRNGLTNKVERLHGTLKDKTKPLNFCYACFSSLFPS